VCLGSQKSTHKFFIMCEIGIPRTSMHAADTSIKSTSSAGSKPVRQGRSFKASAMSSGGDGAVDNVLAKTEEEADPMPER
jgi:hypothetical protein